MGDSRSFQIEVPDTCPAEILEEIAGSLSYYGKTEINDPHNGTITFYEEDMNYGAYGWLDNYGGYAIVNELIANNIPFDLTTGPGDYDGYDISWRPGMEEWLEQTKTTNGEIVLTEAEYRQIVKESDTPEEVAESLAEWFDGPGPLVPPNKEKEDA